MCHYHVRCHRQVNVQKCSNMAPRSLQVVWLDAWNWMCKSCPHISNCLIIIFVLKPGCVRAFLLSSVVTRSMWRTGRSKQSKLHSTGRRTFNTMRFLRRAIITLRSPSFILLENSQGNEKWVLFCCKLHYVYVMTLMPFLLVGTRIFTLLNHLLLRLQKSRLTLPHSNSKCSWLFYYDSNHFLKS